MACILQVTTVVIREGLALSLFWLNLGPLTPVIIREGLALSLFWLNLGPLTPVIIREGLAALQGRPVKEAHSLYNNAYI